MPDVLIFADTIRSPELRHEVPVAVPDPFVYAERDGSRHAFVGSMEIPRLRHLERLECVPLEELGLDELIAQGMGAHELARELVLRACRALGLERAVTPRTFPLEAADYLRANGVDVSAEGDLFDDRRRSKSEQELVGIRRAQRAAEQAMDVIRRRLLAGEVSSEELRSEATRTLTDAGMFVPDLVIVSHGEQTAVGHEPGFGPIAPGEPVVVDLFPHDPESGCYADMTRTFCLGEPPQELVEQHALCREALERVYAAVRPGALGSDLHRIACEVFEEHGYSTQRTKRPGEVLDEGFYHSLGHGVGLEVHELPILGRTGPELVAGDVLAIEPGVYRKGFGGCRLEDLVHVTEERCEVITEYPYDLASSASG